jgi:hypothetical protein
MTPDELLVGNSGGSTCPFDRGRLVAAEALSKMLRSCCMDLGSYRMELYILAQLISSNNGCHDRWFYLRNDDERLPKFFGRVLMSRGDN